MGQGVIKGNEEVKPLSNFDIMDMMDDKNFLGVYSRNNLPPRIQVGESLIMNIDDSEGAGTHWTCIFRSANHTEYFDSFGLPPPQEVLKYSPMVYNTSQVQNHDSVKCGYFCIDYIKKRKGGKSMYDIIYDFNQIINPFDKVPEPSLRY